MNNKYLQNKFGECAYVCIANAFNKPEIIKNAKNLEKGLNWINTRKLIEKETDYTVQNLLFSPKVVKQYLPIFEVDHDFKTNEDLYTMFLASISSERKGYNHCVLIIKENFNPTLTILDPNYKESARVNMYDFFTKYECSEVDSFCNKNHGGTMFFNEKFLSHLLEKASEEKKVNYEQVSENSDKALA